MYKYFVHACSDRSAPVIMATLGAHTGHVSVAECDVAAHPAPQSLSAAPPLGSTSRMGSNAEGPRSEAPASIRQASDKDQIGIR